MNKSQFGFSYSWADLKPVRSLTVVVGGAQASGALAGFALHVFPDWFESAWFGAAVATFPALLVGLVVQSRVRPGSITENAIMVRRLGLIALFLSSLAVAMPVLGFGR